MWRENRGPEVVLVISVSQVNKSRTASPTNVYYLTVSWGQESRCGSARCPQAEGLSWGRRGALLPLAKAVLSSEGSAGGGPSSESLIGVSSSQVAGWSLPLRHRAFQQGN